jgi:hypothetical protein
LADRIAPDVKLLVSELITNSVKYGGLGAVTLKVDNARVVRDRPHERRALTPATRRPPDPSPASRSVWGD